MPIVLHVAIAAGFAELTDTALWIVLLAMVLARSYFSVVRLVGRAIAWYSYEREHCIRDYVDEFEVAQLPAATELEKYQGYFSRLADKGGLPEPATRYAIHMLHYVSVLWAVNLVDKIWTVKALETAMARYSAKLSLAQER
jgi:hypothetical protein